MALKLRGEAVLSDQKLLKKSSRRQAKISKLFVVENCIDISAKLTTFAYILDFLWSDSLYP